MSLSLKKRGKIHDFHVYMYVPCTKISYPDPKFRKCHCPCKKGVKFASFLCISTYHTLRNHIRPQISKMSLSLENQGKIHEFLVYLYIYIWLGRPTWWPRWVRWPRCVKWFTQLWLLRWPRWVRQLRKEPIDPDDLDASDDANDS